MKEERVSSGIPGYDELVQGGFKKDSINLVAGEPGAGKTIFAIQFLVEGCKKGEPGIYITFEEKKKKLYEDMVTFGWDLFGYEKKKLFRVLEYTPEQVKKLLMEGGGAVENLIEDIGATRLVIDSITSFALLYEDELTKKEAALSLFDMIAKFGCTAVLTSQIKPGNELSTIDSSLEFEVDSITLLYHMKIKGERIRAIEILKMRATKTSNLTYGLVIDNKGLRVTREKIK